MKMDQKRERDQKSRRGQRSKDGKRGRTNKADGKSSAPWRSGDVIEREGNAGKPSSDDEIDSGDGKQSGANFAKRQIESNWSKYETILLPGNDDESKASDFNSLASAPLSEGGHFKFKSEQAWETYSPSQFNNLFTLNLNMLSTSLSTIPFYNQLNLPKELFNQDELNRMENEASENDAFYKSLNEATRPSHQVNEPPLSTGIIEGINDLKLHNYTPADDTVLPGKKTIPITTEDLLESDKDEELDFLLALKEPAEQSPSLLSRVPLECGEKTINEESNMPLPSTSSPEKKEDLEDWLDSILDE